MHIYDFFTEEIQVKLKDESRIKGGNRFEKVLKEYRRVFMQYLGFPTHNCQLTTSGADTLNTELQDNPEIRNWFKELLKIALQESTVINDIFTEVIDCYLLFVRGRHHTAVLKMYDVLEKYEMNDEAGDQNLGLYFRCVNLWEGADPQKEETYYHLPFSHRGLVKNQRFSVSGIPLWYGGASMLSSCFELGNEQLEFTANFAISAWGFNPLAGERTIGEKLVRVRSKIYDISNVLYDIVNNGFTRYLNDEGQVNRSFLRDHIRIFKHALRIALRKFALSNLCTFRKNSNDNHFHEEYVIPQLLTEAVRLHKYDGILFPSTRFHDKKIGFTGLWHTNFYKSNLAMFTEFNDSELYDTELACNFFINTITKEELKINFEEVLQGIDHLSKETIDFFHWLDNKNLHSRTKERYRGIFDHLINQVEVYKNVSIESVPYLETIAGKAEAYAILSYLNKLNNQIKQDKFQLEFDDYTHQ